MFRVIYHGAGLYHDYAKQRTQNVEEIFKQVILSVSHIVFLNKKVSDKI